MKKKIAFPIPTYADDLLDEEVQCASTSLAVSCRWAFRLSEAIDGFEASVVTIQDQFDSLSRLLRQHSFSEPMRRKIRKLLVEFRMYCREMADESKPVCVADIIDNGERIIELRIAVEKLLDLSRVQFGHDHGRN